MYKLQAQFEDVDLDVKTITSENVLELLKEVTDEKLRDKILHLATPKSSSSTVSARDNFETQPMAYSLDEVHRRLALSKIPGRDTTFNDLKIEVEKLKREIISLKLSIAFRNLKKLIVLLQVTSQTKKILQILILVKRLILIVCKMIPF